MTKNNETTSPSSAMVAKQFPWKLHDILELAEKNGEESIVSWLPCERAFKVHRREPFENRMMKVFFNQTKYKSFQRQLNLWGFETITDANSPDRGAYYHPLFIKARKELCHCMTRQKIKNPGVKTELANTNPSKIAEQPAEAPGDLRSHSVPRRMSMLTPKESTLYQLSVSSHQAINFGGTTRELGFSLAPRDYLHSTDLVSQFLLRNAEAIRSQTALASLLAERRGHEELNALLALSVRRRASFLL
jgi:hypothetical protein